jgi:hypothetical protein
MAPSFDKVMELAEEIKDSSVNAGVFGAAGNVH